MKFSFAISVCNESKDLYSLLSFLKKVKEPSDDIDVLVDSAHVSPQVRSVLEYFKSDVIVHERAFTDGNFADHRNFQILQSTGDYIFLIDADEMPQEFLIRSLPQIVEKSQADIIAVPRINICPGFTGEWITKCKFNLNENAWINWPDYQCRIIKNGIGLKFNNELHERISGSDNVKAVAADPRFSLWHIKSVDKQDNRWTSDGKYIFPDGNNLYDALM